MREESMLVVDGVGVEYKGDSGPVPALVGVSLTLKEGETIALLGPTGCGKSTLLFAMAGLLQPTEGHVLFQGTELTEPHRQIALVLQDYGLFPWKSVRKNVELGLRIRRERNVDGKVSRLLDEMGILDKEEMYPHQLSGGQKQRVALARALVLNPDLLLLDEPFAALDTLTRERLQDLAASLWQAHHFGMVIVTHNIQEAVRLGKQIAIMSSSPGRITHILENPSALEPGQRKLGKFFEKVDEIRTVLEAAQ